MAKSKFFCENCGKEVRHNAKVCPHCGRFFQAVRCPACSFTGDASLFVHGCPNCGYAGQWGSGAGAGTEDQSLLLEPYDPEAVGADPEAGAGGGYARARGGNSRRSIALGSETSVPGWVYWLAIAILSLAFGILVLIYLQI